MTLESEKKLVEHLVPLVDEEWALWRWIAVRGAGFSANQVLKLSAPSCTHQADQLLALETKIEKLEDTIRQMVNQALDNLKLNQEWHNKKKRKPLLNTLSCLNANKPLKATNNPQIDSALESFQSLDTQLKQAYSNYLKSYQLDREEILQNIYTIIKQDRFQQAIVWQNRNVLTETIHRLLKKPTKTKLSRQRQKEAIIAKYLQRYCVKNDTIGFFGPVGWAKFKSEGNAFLVEPGPSLLAKRNIYFEVWGINELAALFTENESILPWVAPRRIPSYYLKKQKLHLPFAPPIKLSMLEATILQACDGKQTAKKIAKSLLNNPTLGLNTEEEVYSILKSLQKQNRLVWDLKVPIETHPEKTLRYLLDQIEDKETRQSALATLNKFITNKESIAKVVNNASKLNEAIENLEEIFYNITNTQPTRHEGEMYAARTLIYEDCQRDIKIDIGPQLQQSLQMPLFLLLNSARWLTNQVAAFYHKQFQKAYTNLVEQTGSTIIDFPMFWLFINQFLYKQKDASFLMPIITKFQEKWANILTFTPEQQQVTYTSQELYAQVLSEFQTDSPGWPGACHHSPDLMIAASSPKAIEQGNYLLIMGELHLTLNTLQASCFAYQHPNRDELIQAMKFDLPPDRVSIVVSQNLDLTARTTDAFIPSDAFRLILFYDAFDNFSSKILPSGDLVIEQIGSDFIVRTRDGHLKFDIFTIFGEGILSCMVNLFQILKPIKHTPRITIDKLVISRETWRFWPDEIDFAFEKTEEDRFLEGRRWMKENKMPRFVFFKSPIEVKPIYVDFDSPIYVDIFAKAIRQAEESDLEEPIISISEMLPTPDQAWLPDAQGNRYTSELRIVAVDLTAKDIQNKV